MRNETKLAATIIIRFPRSCDIQPPAKNPIMHPRDKAAPKVISFEYNKTLTFIMINLFTNPRNIYIGDLHFFVAML